MQAASGHLRCAREGVGRAADHQRAAAGLAQRRAATERAGQRQRVGLRVERATARAQHHRAVGMQRHRCRRLQRAAGQRQRAGVGAQRAVAVDRQRAGFDRGATAVAVGAGQHQRAAAGLVQRTAAADGTVDREDMALAVEAAASRAQFHWAAGVGGQVGGGAHLPARQPQRAGAGAQAVVGRYRQRAGQHGGATAVVVGSGQCEAARALLDQAAAAADRAGIAGIAAIAGRQREAAQVDRAVDRAAARQRGDRAVGQQLQRHPSGIDQRQRAAGQRLGRRQLQAASGHLRCAREGVGRAADHQRAAAGLAQRRAATERAGQRQRVGLRVERATARAQHHRAVGMQRHRCRRLQRAAGQRQRAGVGAQRAVAVDRQRAGFDRGATAVAAAAGQREPARALLDQRTGAADRARERAVARATRAQREGAQVDRAVDRATAR